MTVIERPSGPNKSTNDLRLTVCKLCPFSIVVGEPKVWLREPMGLSHLACATRAGLR